MKVNYKMLAVGSVSGVASWYLAQYGGADDFLSVWFSIASILLVIYTIAAFACSITSNKW